MNIVRNKQNINQINKKQITSIRPSIQILERFEKTAFVEQNLQEKQIEVSSDIFLKIEKERQLNQQLHSKIKNKYQFFQYQLRPLCVNPNLRCSQLIQQYDKVIRQRQYLEQQLAKIQFRVGLKEREKTSAFQFMVDVWRKNRESEGNCQEVIDRLNKIVLLVEKGVRRCMEEEKDENFGYPQQIVLKSSQYQTLLKEYENAQDKIKKLEQNNEKQTSKLLGQISSLKKQNSTFKTTISELTQKYKELCQNEIVLYRKINQLTADIMDKESELQTIRQQNKQKSMDICVNYATEDIKKERSILQGLEDNILESISIASNSNRKSSCHSRTSSQPQVQDQNSISQLETGSLRSHHSSSKKAQRHLRFPTSTIETPTQIVKLKFIRRR